MTYPITFACYGCPMHGSESGSVDRAHNVSGTPILQEDSALAAFEGQRMDQSSYYLDQVRRDAVWEAIQEVGAHRGWSLLAAPVRSNHVHTVFGGGDSAGANHERLQSLRQPPCESSEAG